MSEASDYKQLFSASYYHFFRVGTAAGIRGKIRGYASNYACGGGAGACSGDEAPAKEHEYHQAQINRRCRGCGQICKNTYTHKIHNEKADETSNTKGDREGETQLLALLLSKICPTYTQQAFVTNVTQK